MKISWKWFTICSSTCFGGFSPLTDTMKTYGLLKQRYRYWVVMKKEESLIYINNQTEPPISKLHDWSQMVFPPAICCVWGAVGVGLRRNGHEPFLEGAGSKCLWSLISTVWYKRILMPLSVCLHKSLFRGISLLRSTFLFPICVCGWARGGSDRGSDRLGCHGYTRSFSSAWLWRAYQKVYAWGLGKRRRGRVLV